MMCVSLCASKREKAPGGCESARALFKSILEYTGSDGITREILRGVSAQMGVRRRSYVGGKDLQAWGSVRRELLPLADRFESHLGSQISISAPDPSLLIDFESRS